MITLGYLLPNGLKHGGWGLRAEPNSASLEKALAETRGLKSWDTAEHLALLTVSG